MKGVNMAAKAIAAVIAGGGMYMDLKEKRISNLWILAGMAAGYIVRLYTEGLHSLPDAAGGMLLPVLLLGWMFIFRMLGAGDIKILSAAGICLGTRNTLGCIGWSFLIGACISLILLFTRCQIYERFKYLGDYIRAFIRTGSIKPYYQKGENRPENFAFTVPVFLAVLLTAAGG